MRLAYPREPATLDPLAPGGGAAATRDILRPVLPQLFALDDRLRPHPDLAASWPRGGDVRFDPFSVTVRLRPARWSDGRAITSRDVRFSWTKLRAGPTGYRYRTLRDVQVLDARRFRLRFSAPLRRWWSLFSVDDMVLPAHAYGPDWSKRPTVSGGPFSVRSWERGLRVRLVRNDAYWGRRPALAGIEVVFVPDDETSLQLLRRGRVDVVFAEGEPNFGRRARAYGFPSGDTTGGGAHASGAFGPTWWELDLDPGRLTTAVASAVIEAVHPTLAAEILEDSGHPMNAIEPDPTSSRPVAEPWRGRGSLARAKALLDRGGVRAARPRVSFRLAYARDAGGGVLATFIHYRLAAVGITVELAAIDPDTFESTWVPGRAAPAMLRLRRGADAPDAGSYAASADAPGSGPVEADVASAMGNVSRVKLSTGPVIGLSASAWAAAEAGLARAATTAPLVRARTWLVARAGVRGPEAAGAAPGPLWNAGEWSSG